MKSHSSKEPDWNEVFNPDWLKILVFTGLVVVLPMPSLPSGNFEFFGFATVVVGAIQGNPEISIMMGVPGLVVLCGVLVAYAIAASAVSAYHLDLDEKVKPKSYYKK